MINSSSPSAVPASPTPFRTYDPFLSVKAATPDLLIDSGTVEEIEILSQLFIEEIGGQELINISRHDLINGQNLSYSPIKNITRIASRYSSNNIIPIQNNSSSIFNNFSIKLDEYLPPSGENSSGQYLSSIGTGPAGQPIYIDPANGNLVINVVNLRKDEQVEIQIIRNKNLINATIYEEEL